MHAHVVLGQGCAAWCENKPGRGLCWEEEAPWGGRGKGGGGAGRLPLRNTRWGERLGACTSHQPGGGLLPEVGGELRLAGA